MTDEEQPKTRNFRNVSEWHTQAVRAREEYFAAHPEHLDPLIDFFAPRAVEPDGEDEQPAT